MNTVIEYLRQLELSEIEAKLYLALLQKGPTSARELAEEIGIKRTTVYTYINLLIEKGLVMKLIRNSDNLLMANSAEETLEHLVKQKLESANIAKKELHSVLKTIKDQLSTHETTEEAEIKFYKGKKGVLKIYEDALKAKEIRSYVDLSKMGGLFPENSEIFINGFATNEELHIFEIFEDSPLSNIAIENQSTNPRFHYKFHPKEISFSAADTLIYDGKVGIINSRNNDISGIILKNNEYYNNSKELFDFIWKMLPEVSIEKGLDTFSNLN